MSSECEERVTSVDEKWYQCLKHGPLKLYKSKQRRKGKEYLMQNPSAKHNMKGQMAFQWELPEPLIPRNQRSSRWGLRSVTKHLISTRWWRPTGTPSTLFIWDLRAHKWLMMVACLRSNCHKCWRWLSATLIDGWKGSFFHPDHQRQKGHHVSLYHIPRIESLWAAHTVVAASLEMPHLMTDLSKVSRWLGRVPGGRGTLTHPDQGSDNCRSTGTSLFATMVESQWPEPPPV